MEVYHYWPFQLGIWDIADFLVRLNKSSTRMLGIPVRQMLPEADLDMCQRGEHVSN
jgi:hypothetical protein